MSERFRQELIVAALNGFTANSFLAEQLAALDALSFDSVRSNSVGIIAQLSIQAADEVLKRISNSEEMKTDDRLQN